MEDRLDLLSTAEAADMIGVAVATINRWAAKGKLPIAHKLPGDTGAHLYDRSDVEVLLADQGSAA